MTETRFEQRATELRALPIEAFAGHLSQLDANVRAGTGSPALLRAMQSVGLERQDELEELRAARRRAQALAFAEAREREKEVKEGVAEAGWRVETVELGRGAKMKVKVPN